MRLVFAYAALSLMASAPTLRAESFVPPPPAEIFSQVVPEPEVCDAFEPTGARIVAAGDFVRTGATVSTLVNAADNTDAVTISPASPGYSVQQSVIFAEGTGAFRLANASFQSVYLTLNDTIVPTFQTRLFFIGVMGYATTDQSAQVEVSTNNGSTWNVVWSLRGAGASGPTQQRFELESISLAPYAGMSIRVRFGAVFTSGSVYNPASSTMIGWYVDDIQIGTSFNGIPYNSVGDPTPDEILAVEYINRARADAVAEAVRLRDTGDADVRSACTFFGVNFT
ncbi:MAG TPA: hypothetical protein PKI32_07930, partial [Opitutales bacterium]|nr:hypothetical protein [Opitutales bacterium]